MGNDLTVAFGDAEHPDVVIKGFYDPAFMGNSPQGIFGRGPDGLLYEYNPQNGGLTGVTAALVDGAAPVTQAMGSSTVQGVAAIEVSTLLPAATVFSPLTATMVGVGVAAVVRSGGSSATAAPEPAPSPGGDTNADAGAAATLVQSDAAVSNTEKTAVSFTVAGLDADATGVVTFTDGTTTVAANVAADGTQTVNLSALADGPITSSLVITDTAGNTVTKTGSNFTLDTAAPATPVINMVAGDDKVNLAEATATFNLTGTGEAGATVVASFTSGRTLTSGNSVVVANDGTWSLVIRDADVGAFGQGAETITINQTDAAGNANASAATRAITVDTGLPTPTLTSVGNIAVTGSASVRSTERGTAYLVDSTLTVSSQADILALADSQYNSVAITTANTATTLALAGLASGSYKLYAIDAAGNLSAGTGNTIGVYPVVNLSAIAAGAGGFVINGQGASDLSGWSVSSAGDVNGDGLVDVIVGAKGANTDTGKSYVVFGQTGTTAIELSAVEAGTGGFVINGQASGDLSGVSVSNAGDVNGDGLADLIVGARGFNNSAGRTYLVFGQTATTAINLSAVAGGTGGFAINSEATGNLSGFSVSVAGDVNGDGLADLIVGARSFNTSAGRSYVVFGQTGTTAIDLSAVAAGTGGFAINGQLSNDNSGYSVSNAGDVNGDGLADLIVGAYAANANKGKSYVVFGQTGTTAINLSAVAAGTSGFVINGLTSTDFSGYSVSNAGDVNGDGLADLIVGAPSTAITNNGYVVFGKTDNTAIDMSAVVAGTGGFVINPEAIGTRVGTSVSAAGDLNGDGLADLLVGAPSTCLLYTSDAADE
jgi:hypothetical protein